MKRYIPMMLTLAALLLVLSGCTGNSTKPLAVESIELFEGDAVKFRPFLGGMSGAIKLDYTGSKTDMKIDLEEWENGVKKANAGGMSDLLFNRRGTEKYKSEIIYAVETIEDMDSPTKLRLKIASAGGNSTVTISG